jgi:hypothetical protein
MDFYNDLYVKPEINTFNFKPYEPTAMPALKLGCTECGNLSGHYPSCSWSTSTFIKPMEPLKPLSTFNNFEKSDNYLRPSDFPKLNKVKKWVKVDNPVIATCRSCNHTGLVDNTCIGLY